MKPARSLMDLYRTETYHEINIKHKIKTNSSNTFSMCVRSIIAIELGKLLRHQTLDKKRTRETLTHPSLYKHEGDHSRRNQTETSESNCGQLPKFRRNFLLFHRLNRRRKTISRLETFPCFVRSFTESRGVS